MSLLYWYSVWWLTSTLIIVTFLLYWYQIWALTSILINLLSDSRSRISFFYLNHKRACVVFSVSLVIDWASAIWIRLATRLSVLSTWYYRYTPTKERDKSRQIEPRSSNSSMKMRNACVQKRQSMGKNRSCSILQASSTHPIEPSTFSIVPPFFFLKNSNRSCYKLLPPFWNNPHRLILK
jgi:hypothetical protein